MNNGTLNCQESFMLTLQTGLHKDLGTFHQIPPREIQRDVAYVEGRVQSEGTGFLTKTLPAIAKSLDQSLQTGNFLCPSAFKTYKGTKLPCFMRRFFERVFDNEGQLKLKPDVEVIKDIRQVGYLFYKYQLPYQDHLVRDTIREFIRDDESISDFTGDVSVQSILYYASEVANEIFKRFTAPELRCKNGPGSVANGQKPWQRYRPTRFYRGLNGLIPYDRMFYHSDRHLFDRFSEWFDCPDGDSVVMARLLAVPKDSRGPRLISSEHSEFMVYQQHMRQHIVPWVENHPLTGGQVNFRDQSVNGALALQGSVTGALATLDLSKASDLLSLDLVSAVFEDTPIHDYLMNSRSHGTSTPEGNLIFRKFAPMGSALCFPVQAITFYCLLVGRMVANGEKLGVAAHRVWVYGDDIIVPTSFVPEAISVLEAVGLRINDDKSCYTGYFRESCGVDAFMGVDVTPIKLKKVWNTKPDAQTTVAWLSACNLLHARGYWNLADIIRQKLQRLPGGYKFPCKTEDSPVLGFNVCSTEQALLANRSRLQWNHRYQCWSLRAKCAVNKPKALLHDGWKRMLRHGWEKSSVDLIIAPDSLPFQWDEAPFSTDAFIVRNTMQIKYSLVTEAFM